MRLRPTKVLALAAIGMMIAASSAAAATDFTPPCTTAEAACLAQRLTAVETWIEANDTDAPAPSPSPAPSPTTATATWDGSIRYGSAAAGKATPLAVAITPPSGAQENKIVYVEAWQNNVRKADVFAEGRDLTGTTTQNLSLPALPAGVYELRLMVFDGPPAGSYTWGAVLLKSVEQNLTVPAATAPTSTTTGVLYDGPGQVDQFAGYDVLKTTPTGIWVGDWEADIQARAAQLRKDAGGKTIPLVVYNIPGRDGNDFSAGGASSVPAYKLWVDKLAAGLGTAPVIISLEPDALALYSDLTAARQVERSDAMKYAVQKLKENPNAKVYVDASNWIDPSEMQRRIKTIIPAGGTIDGISVNVAAHNSNASIIDYGNRVIAASGLPWKMIVDTSRNGVATATTWCNPTGQGLGKLPTLTPGIPNVDAFLWIKTPGESDGTCNGGPPAGAFFPDRAQELIDKARL